MIRIKALHRCTVCEGEYEADDTAHCPAYQGYICSLCCSLDEGGPSFYNTEQAVVWLCRSAAQNYAPAARRLGEIYSGDLVAGVRVMRRVAEKVVDPRTNLPVSYAWLQRAQTLGISEAGGQAAKVFERMTPAERATAATLTSGAKPLACEWGEVIGA